MRTILNYNRGKAMTDLTEQWKKGELSEGIYYVTDGEEVTIDYYLCDYWERNFYSDIQQVLAKVPSYGEWQETLRALDAAHKAIKMEDETINRLVSSGKQRSYENAKFKELLKECLEVLKMVSGETIDFPRTVDECIDKINQVLGEDK